ncbi:hypothetical protein, partial [Novosphingobium sp. ST904]|uniref:hypothetical protein n=1 Tax=Novosphingobium sp. ST904 TaxID=1684385 RepID=UPI001E32248A
MVDESEVSDIEEAFELTASKDPMTAGSHFGSDLRCSPGGQSKGDSRWQKVPNTSGWTCIRKLSR